MSRKYDDIHIDEDLDVLDLDEEDVFYEEADKSEETDDIADESVVIEEVFEDESFEEEILEDKEYEENVEEYIEIYEDETVEYEEMANEEYDEAEEAFGTSYPHNKEKKRTKDGLGIMERILNMDTMDKVIMSLGCLVLVLVVVAVGIFASYKISDGQVLAFADMGNDVDKISLIGESGLLAVTDATIAKIDALEDIKDEDNDEEDEKDEDVKGSITVQMVFTSVQKDLKIKFVNQKNGKMIAGIPFEVSLITPSGKTLNWKDDDKDGVIYYKNIEAGEYKISLVELEGEIYEKYIIDTKAQPVTVKKDISYTKIDVSGEIKSESEINAAEEDTAISNTTESTLTDTVAFVSPSVIPAGKGYEEINKSLIAAPTTTSALSTASMPYAVALALYTEPNENMARTVEGIQVSPESVSVEVGKQTTLQVTNQLEGMTIVWTSSDSTVATVSDGIVTGVGVGSCTITADDGNGHTASCQITVTAPVAALTVTPQTAEVEIGKKVTLSASEAVIWTSDKNEVATVDENGVVTGKAEGTAVITATSAANGTTASATITVKAATTSLKVTLEKEKVEVVVGETYTLKASVTGQTDATEGKMQWESSDKTLATVDANGVLTALKEGTVTITATYTEKETTVKATCTVTIKSGTYLKTTDNQDVYVLKNDQYVKATTADYSKADVKFYIYTDIYHYTGWQTFNGKTYYYGPDYKKVTGEQVILGAKYVFDANGVLTSSNGVMGIDVSKWNGTIDWVTVKNSGINYVIIRCGYRGTSTGALVEDPKFKANIKGATDAGLKVGVYFFSQAIDEIEAVQEASMVLSLISGYKISYPIFLDVEAASNGRANGISKDMRTKVCKAFCQTIQNSGYTAGVYANKDWLTNKIDASQLGSYKIWLAQYASKPTYTGRYEMWQYKDTGSVPGISGHVDLNLSYLGF